MFLFFFHKDSIHALATTKKGFNNSLGWSVCPKNSTHLFAPLTVMPY